MVPLLRAALRYRRFCFQAADGGRLPPKERPDGPDSAPAGREDTSSSRRPATQPQQQGDEDCVSFIVQLEPKIIDFLLEFTARRAFIECTVGCSASVLLPRSCFQALSACSPCHFPVGIQSVTAGRGDTSTPRCPATHLQDTGDKPSEESASATGTIVAKPSVRFEIFSSRLFLSFQCN